MFIWNMSGLLGCIFLFFPASVSLVALAEKAILGKKKIFKLYKYNNVH